MWGAPLIDSLIYWGEKYIPINAPVFLGYNRHGGLGVRANFLQTYRCDRTDELVVFHIGKVDRQVRFNCWAGIASDHDWYTPDEIFNNIVKDARKGYKSRSDAIARENAKF